MAINNISKKIVKELNLISNTPSIVYALLRKIWPISFTHKSPSVAFSWPQANLCDTINRRRAKLWRKASRQFYPFVSFIPKLNCSMVSWRAPNIIQCTFFCLKFFEVVYIVSRSHLCILVSFNFFFFSTSFSFNKIS